MIYKQQIDSTNIHIACAFSNDLILCTNVDRKRDGKPRMTFNECKDFLRKNTDWTPPMIENVMAVVWRTK